MRCGNEVATGTYYEVLEGGGEGVVLMIHGGGATGACFRADLEDRPGWADLLARRGYTVWVTDWPGCGRSGKRVLVDIEYGDVVEGYRQVLRHVIGVPVVVVCHSMGGAVAWQLVEQDRDLVAGVVAVAAAYPGNLSAPSEVLGEDGSIITVRFRDTGVRFLIDRSRGYLYEDEYIYQQAIASSKRFPMGLVERMRASLVPLPPKMLLQRMGVIPGMPVVQNTRGFRGLGVRLVAGSEDPAHTLSIERATAELLLQWGAEVEVVWLPDRGIEGNGHFLFFEDNADQVLDVIAEQIKEVSRQ